MSCWQDNELKYYYEGTRYGEYPSLIMDRLANSLSGCRSLLDICCGPGAYALWGLEHDWRVTACDMSETALTALKNRAGENRDKLNIICGDLLETRLPAADLAVAACCFYQGTESEAVLGRMLDLGKKAALFVRHAGPQPCEFGTEGLPAFAKKHIWQINDMESNLQKAADSRGLTLNSFEISCDFGCFYDPGDKTLLKFISNKSGVRDLQLLAARLRQNAVNKPQGLWLPNIKRYNVTWCVKET